MMLPVYIRFTVILLMCMVLPACVKKTTHTRLVKASDNSLDKKTLIDDCVDERFDVYPSSIANKGAKNSVAMCKNQSTGRQPLSICQAKLFDIPTPLQAVFQADSIRDSIDGLSIDYSIVSDRLVIADFYEQEMERLGWQQLTKNDTDKELLLVFDKPTKVCVVSIRTAKDSRVGLVVVVTTGAKKMGHPFE